MADLDFISALDHRENVYQGDLSAIGLEKITDRGMIDLRINSDDKKALKSAETALGVPLPQKPQSSTTNEEITVLWWSIDQWIITFPIELSDELLRLLVDGLANFEVSITDVAHARSIIRLTGQDAKTTLMKGISVDLTLSDIQPGYVRRTAIGDAAIAIHVVATEDDAIDVYIFRSYTEFLWNWLVCAGRQSAKISLFGAQSAPQV